MTHIMAKPSGSTCNSRCGYCFYVDKGREGRMSDDVMRAYLRASGSVRAWQGGEPTLMGLQWFKDAEHFARRLPGPMERTFQTNGLLLDDEWCAFLKKHDYLVGLSIDGPAELHDELRRTKGDEPTHEQVMRALALLLKRGVRVNAMVAVTSANVLHPKSVYFHLRDAGIQFMQFLPVPYRRDQPLGIGEGAWGSFMCGVLDAWKPDIGNVFVMNVEWALAAAKGLRSICVHERTCGSSLVVEHNGDVFACDHFTEPEHLRGNVLRDRFEDMAHSWEQIDFGLDKWDNINPACRSCDVLAMCYGGCPKDRDETGLNRLCAGYKRFFRKVKAEVRV